MNRPLLFIDSGAYSAETKGVKISLPEYMTFLKLNEQYVEVAAGLDVLFNADATYANQLTMEAEGINAMPCISKRLQHAAPSPAQSRRAS